MFHVKIEQDEDGIFIATVPALPGCVSDGSTREEALENVQDAIEGWLAAEDQKAIDALPEADRSDLVLKHLRVA
jgi:predicted RNase H-like HicB family nuclease